MSGDQTSHVQKEGRPKIALAFNRSGLWAPPVRFHVFTSFSILLLSLQAQTVVSLSFFF
jgi:hypothetical protein